MINTKARKRTCTGAVGLLLLLVYASTALGHVVTTPKVVGSAKAGRSVFSSTCAVCHTLKAAGAVGIIGPNLDKVAPKLSEALIIKAVASGGASIMTQATRSKYTTQMSAYKGTLTATQITNVAAFIYTTTHRT